MDLSKDMLCRLCGLNIPDGNCKNIFEGSTDLMHKIKETLPISISTNDNGSKYLCLPCYEKIILYYKFVQEVVEYSKRIGSIMQKKSYFDFSKDMIDLSKIHSDAVYTCPNCNVNLMILLVSNPHGCDYTFQISLAMLNCSGKRHVIKESNIQERKNREEFIIAKNQIDLRNASKLVVADDNKNIPEQVSPAFPVLTEEPSLTSANTLLDKVKTEESNSFVPIQRKETRKEIECSEYLLNCDYDFVETVQQNEPGSDNTCWLGSDTDCKSNKGKACTNESENDTFKTDVVQDEHDVYKSCLKYICKLCGARYLSHMKYEFHMERHKLDKINKYECTVCDKETSNENMLWDHYFHTHKSQQRFVCIECGKLFAKRSRLNRHQKHYNHSGIRQIQIGTDEDNYGKDVIKKSLSIKQDTISVNCNLCGKIISDLDLDGINDLVTCPTCEDSTLSLMVDGNETKVISPRQYHCSMCPKHFVRKERLEFHEMRHNENMNEFVCSTCGKEFRAENSLYEHYLFVHKGARPHICELCGKSFQLKARLKEHHRIHTGERPYQCDVCGQRCRTMNALKLHRKIHFSHNKYTCNICNKTFTKKQNMNEHLEKHWKNDKNVTLPQLFTCPICTEDFPTYRMLRYHMVEVHEINTQDPILTKQKPWYECLECHEKFKHQMSLKAHKEKVHEGRVNPLYQCDTCNATYRVKQLLVNHIKSKHNGEKRYKCAQCEKGFNDTKSLYNHVLLHTGRKPFVCEYCNMSFRRKDSRDHHRRKHTGEQPYQCPDCGESFSTYNNRSKHRKKEHGEGDPECPECGERCSNQQEIRIHLNKHLGEKLNKLQSQI